jgi:hypothetical protein
MTTIRIEGRIVHPEQVGIDRRTLISRIARGWSFERAISTPPRRYPSNVRRARSPRAQRPVEADDASVPELDPVPAMQEAVALMLSVRHFIDCQPVTTPRGVRLMAALSEWLRRVAP